MQTAVPYTHPKKLFLFSVPKQPRHGGLFASPVGVQSLSWMKHWRPKGASGKGHTRRLLPFRNFPPPPKRSMKPLPAGLVAARAYVESRFHAGEGYTVEGIALLCLVQQMQIDSVLRSREWRLELVWTGKKGYPYFGLYWRHYVVGIVDIPVQWGQAIQSCPDLRRLHSQMAAYLVCCGFLRTNTTLLEGLAQTPVSASKRAVYHLFK